VDPHFAQLLAGILKPGLNGDPHRFLDVAVPIRNSRQESLGVVGAHLYLDWMHNISATVLGDLGKHTPIEVLIADHQGHWIIKPATESATTLKELDAKVESSPFITARTKVAFKAPMHDTNWTVLVREETRYTYAAIHANRLLITGLSLLVTLMITAIAWVVSGRVVQPIVSLVDVALAHIQGEAQSSDARYISTMAETGVLAQVMHKMAFYDFLTSLANRRLLREHLMQAQQLAARTKQQGALILVDLDNFSLLNDTQGESVGDQVLIEMAARLSSLAGANDTVARLGGDQFVWLVTGLDSLSASDVARQKAEAALGAIERPLELGGELHHYTASVGVCLFSGQDCKVAELLKQVEVAMFDAKRNEHSKVRFYNNEMQAVLDERAMLERNLRQAIPGELRVLYQPQVNVRGDFIGAEVLVRWQHPTMGMVSPARFIPVAEATGMIVAIGQWVLEQACWRLCTWQQAERFQRLVLAVNVSTKEFMQPDFVERVTRIVRNSGIDPTKLKLELTESILANDVTEIVSRMHALKLLGVSFALDDFGTGFSSLAYLKQMPLDQLKIDQSFVRQVHHNSKDAAIVHAIIALGKSMKLDVIAEGVETQEQYTFLCSAGCHSYQGYLFGRPLTADELEARIPVTPS
jgi:diguanylate cyclase (GGDEF)-like protein